MGRFVGWFLPALLAVLLALVGTARGTGVSPDSCHYLSATENIAAGRGAVTSITLWTDAGDVRPLLQYPPLLPAILSLGVRCGLTVDTSARLICSGSFALGVLLFAALVDEFLRRTEIDRRDARRAAMVAGLLACLWVPWLNMSLWAWSDAPFVLLFLGTVHCVLRADRETGGGVHAGWMFGATATVALALLLRYAAAGLGIGFAGWCAWRARREKGRRRLALLSGPVVAAIPAVLWLTRNHAATGSAVPELSGSPFSTLPVILGKALQAIPSLLVPFPVYREGPYLSALLRWDLLAGGIVVAGLTILALLPGARRLRMRACLTRIRGFEPCLALSFAYLVGVVLASSLAGFTLLPPRYLVPGMIPLSALGLAALLTALQAPEMRGTHFFRGVVVTCVLASTFLALSGSACVVVARRGLGYRDPAWEAQPSARFARGLENERFLSDHIEGAWHVVRRPVKFLPGPCDLEGLKSLVHSPPDAVLWIHRGGFHGSPAAATLEDLLAAGLEEGWEPLAIFPEAALYRPRR